MSYVRMVAKLDMVQCNQLADYVKNRGSGVEIEVDIEKGALEVKSPAEIMKGIKIDYQLEPVDESST